MRLDPLLPPIVIALAAAGLVAGGVVSALRGARSFSRVAGVAMARLAATGALSVLLLRPIAPEPAETGGLPRALAIVERALAEPAALGAAARGGEVELFEFEAPAAGDRAEETRVGAPSSIDRRDTRSLGEASSAAIAACGALPGAALLVLGESAGTEDAAVLAARLCSLGARVWAIVPPQEEPRELRLGRVSIAPLEPRVNEPVVASAEMEARVPGPARVRASWSLDGRLATSQEIELRTGLNRVEHAFVCPSAGLHRLRVEVEPLDGETDPADNASGAFFRANAGLRRALLLEGTPRPVFRAIRRALAGAFALVASSAAERSRPSPGVPADEVSLDEFALVILGDLSASEFAPGALERLASWVRRGGGLLAVAGERNLGPGLWGLSALAPVLPVEVGPADGEVAGPLDARPAGRVGEPRPFPFGSLWAGVTPGAGEVPACSWRELPELARAREVSGLREGASVPLIAARPGRTVPLLVHGRAGKGRVAVILSDDVARWADAGGAARLAHDEFWRDLAAGLARELGAGETRIWLEAVPGLHTAGEEIPFTVYVTDASAPVLVRLARLGARDVAASPAAEGRPSQTSDPGRLELRLEPGGVVRHSAVNVPAEGIYILSATLEVPSEAEGATPPAGSGPQPTRASAETRIEVGAAGSDAEGRRAALVRPAFFRAALRRLEAACAISGGALSGPEGASAFLDTARRPETGREPFGVPGPFAPGQSGGTRARETAGPPHHREAAPVHFVSVEVHALLACFLAFIAIEWWMRRAWNTSGGSRRPPDADH